MSNSIFNAVKIQSRLVIPIIRELEKEIGKERTHALIGCAIANAYVDYRKLKGFKANSYPRLEQEFDNGFLVEREVIDDTEETYGYNIAHCELAEYFRAKGEPEIGALMTCSVDYAAEGVDTPRMGF